MYTDKITQAIAEAAKKILEGEKLHPNQQKIDVVDDEKIDGKDFAKLRKMKEDVGLDEASEKSVAGGIQRARQDVDYHKKNLDSMQKKISRGDREIEHGRWKQLTQSDATKLQQQHKQADDDLTKAHKDVKKTPVSKFLQTRKGDGKVRTEEVEGMVQPSFSDLMESYREGGLKGFFENFQVVQEEPTNDEYTAEVKKAQAKSEGKDKADVAKAAVQAVQSEEVEQIDEEDRRHIARQYDHNQSKHYNDGADHGSELALDAGFKHTARAGKKDMLADNPHKKGTQEHKDWHRGALDGHNEALDNM